MVNGWQLEGVVAPHDFTISAAPVRITGAGERVLAFHVAETRPAGSLLHKFILVHEGGPCDIREVAICALQRHTLASS